MLRQAEGGTGWILGCTKASRKTNPSKPCKEWLSLGDKGKLAAFPTMSQHAKSTAALKRIMASRDQPLSLASLLAVCLKIF